MARARNIKPSFFVNDALGECEPLARLLFAGLWTIADRAGRVEDRPKKIKAELLPYDDCDPDKLLNQLSGKYFLIRYEVDGIKYIQIVNFEKHQNPHVKEAESTIPAPDKHHASPVQNVPYPLSPIPLPDSPIPLPPSKGARKISLAELSVDHIREWLAEKRIQGRYVDHDEHFILEQFKNYCQSKGKKYEDYTAGYRNAFEWERCQPKQSASGTGYGKSKLQRTIEAAERATVARERQYQEGG